MTLILEYSGSEKINDLTKCEFVANICSSDKITREIILEVEKFINNNLFLKDCAQCKTNFSGDKFKLIIIGKGWDGRCRWCRSFRNKLKQKLSESKILMDEKGLCKFDKESKRGIPEIEILKKRKAHMELGIEEGTTQAEYDRICKKIDGFGKELKGMGEER